MLAAAGAAHLRLGRPAGRRTGAGRLDRRVRPPRLGPRRPRPALVVHRRAGRARGGGAGVRDVPARADGDDGQGGVRGAGVPLRDAPGGADRHREWASAAPAVAAVAGAAPGGPGALTAAPHAVTYLRVSAVGLPAMLIVLAATGVLRGFQDTRTPLYVAVAGFAANIALNALLIYGLGFGVAGSAWGTVLAQCAMAAAYLRVVLRGARAHGARLRPSAAGVLASARAGVPLLIRTLSLRGVLLIATAVAARFGDVDVAAHQITLTVWTLLALALDAVAIAGQAIIGRYLGADDAAGARSACRRMIWWGVVSGVVMGVLLAAASPLLPRLFTGDEAVHERLLPVLLVVAVTQPVAGVVFVLDGVLMGAGDGTYLAVAMLFTLAVFTPAALLVPELGGGLTALWWTLAGLMMGTRLLTLLPRARTGRWAVTGAVRA
ncbi:MATE family efflux transporter [Streptomyces hainanensis]|uniref:MATE family efflux transporter n=1 Tax=Streptomyces hainanensis TaxID=402648 RepID=A0A4R4TKB7_9ACTN|nr:MATE family efflux transporter [Streptomyces hainanensis]